MMNLSARTRILLGLLLVGTTLVATIDYRVTSHKTVRAERGSGSLALVTSRTRDLEAVIDSPGPLAVRTVHSADWAASRGGLVNLDDPKAKAAHLEDDDEPIHIDFHVVIHPAKGAFLIDTGVERALRDDPARSVVSGMLARFMHLEKLHALTPLGDYLERERVRPEGVFLTHLHLDHISGMGDVPLQTPIFVGTAETSSHAPTNPFLAPTINRALEGRAPLLELPFERDADGIFDGVIDVFGDSSLFALLVPGHTTGSTAFVARTPEGAVLYVGDTCHTAWGWDNDVEPGWFTADHEANRASLEKLRALVARHPETVVHLGHQDASSSANGRARLSAERRP